jgi:hypothetical protein
MILKINQSLHRQKLHPKELEEVSVQRQKRKFTFNLMKQTINELKTSLN